MKTIKQYILETLINEELDDNLFYLLETWFKKHQNEKQEFIELISKCKKDKVTDEENLKNYIKNTYLEKHLEEFIDFLENDIEKNNQKEYFYSLKKIINTIIFDKNNEYIKKEEF